MRISVHLTPNAKHEKIERVDVKHYKVSLTAPPHEGRANRLLIEMLAAYFDVPKTSVRIIRGAKSREKVVEVGK